MVVQCMRTVLDAVQQNFLDTFLPSFPLPLPLPIYPLSPCISLLLTAAMEVKEREDERRSAGRERERVSEQARVLVFVSLRAHVVA